MSDLAVLGVSIMALIFSVGVFVSVLEVRKENRKLLEDLQQISMSRQQKAPPK